MGAIFFPLRLALALLLAALVLPFRPLRAASLAAGGLAGVAALTPGGGPPQVASVAQASPLVADIAAALEAGDFALAAALLPALPEGEAARAAARPALVQAALARVRPLPAEDAAGNHAGYAFLAALDPATPDWAARAAHYAGR